MMQCGIEIESRKSYVDKLDAMKPLEEFYLNL